MAPNAYSSTQGGIRSNIGSIIGSLLVEDTINLDLIIKMKNQ